MSDKIERAYRFVCMACQQDVEQSGQAEMLLPFPLHGEAPIALDCCTKCARKIKNRNELCETYVARRDLARERGLPEPEMPKQLQEEMDEYEEPEAAEPAARQAKSTVNSDVAELMKLVVQGQAAILGALQQLAPAAPPPPPQPKAKKANAVRPKRPRA